MLAELFADFYDSSKFSVLIPFNVFAFLLFSTLIAIWYYYRVGRKAYYLSKLPGIPTKPFVGNITLLTNGFFKPIPTNINTSIIIKFFYCINLM